jgi:uncharacterized protein
VKMLFALNYSKPAAALFKAGKLELDLFKCTDWDDMVTSALELHRTYVHFPLVAGREHIGDLDRTAAFAERTATRLISAHCAPLPEGDPLARVVKDLAVVSARFGAERVIIENYPYPIRGFPLTPEAAKAEYLHKVIEASRCGFLLDLSHAQMAADYFKIDPFQYIASLPVKNLKELHVVGAEHDPARGWIDHSPMGPRDWQLFEWALAEIAAGNWATPEIVTCEYGGEGSALRDRSDPQVLQRDIPRMIQMVRQAQAKMDLDGYSFSPA